MERRSFKIVTGCGSGLGKYLASQVEFPSPGERREAGLQAGGAGPRFTLRL